jgi:hypothetical protein
MIRLRFDTAKECSVTLALVGFSALVVLRLGKCGKKMHVARTWELWHASFKENSSRGRGGDEGDEEVLGS